MASVRTPGVLVTTTPRARRRLEIDVVVADRDVGHTAEPGPGGVQQRGVHAIVQQGDERVTIGGDVLELVGGERAVIRRDPEVRLGSEQGKRGLGESAGDDDAGARGQ